jgi:hypothetical protein
VVESRDWSTRLEYGYGIQYAQTGEDILDAYWQTLVVGKLSGGFESAKAGFVEWDEVVRSNFRDIPTSKYLKRTSWILALPSIVKKSIEMAKFGLSAGHLMTFRGDMTVATNRRLLAPSLAKKGDHIALVKGSKVPLVLRTAADGLKWNLIGHCYVHGIMRGEAFDEDQLADIWIV